MPIKVIIYEDNDDLRDSLSQTLEEAKGLELLTAFPNCEFVKEHVEVYKPDVVLMDIDMPVVNGLQGVKIISQNFPALPVIMLTVFEDDKNIFEAICNGATGYLLKKSSPEKIIDSIKEVINGGAPMTASVARRVLSFFPRSSTKDETNHLSAREMEILSWLVKGNSYKMIANELSISIDTVRSHIKKIYEKLHVNSATEAVSKALNEKIV
ncbi:MAG TPA: response regulator transcription factor [Chitinophagales bacterium]|nr:response regulator transcription factor [Chitinophagales bacterium]